MRSSTLPFQNKTVLVTGAASGIGLAIAQQFLREGANVVAEDSNPAVEQTFAGNKRVAVLVADAGRDGNAVKAVQLAREQFGGLDVLVNNVARSMCKSGVDMTLGDWNAVMDVTSSGMFLHSREALKAMIPDGSGSIVNVGPYACFQGSSGVSCCTTAKGKLAEITKSLALEAIRYGIRVNAVAAGDVEAHLLNTFRADGRDLLWRHGRNAPIKRAAQPEEIAEVVAFLASEKASFIVGAILMADGGMSISIPNQQALPSFVGAMG